MCFMIDENATPWNNLLVYKVVARTKQRGVYKPLYYKHQIRYRAGKAVEIPADAVTTYKSAWSTRAETNCGIYVFKTLALARRYRNIPKISIIEMMVDPADFLYASANTDCQKGAATYRKATPTGKVHAAVKPRK